MFCLCHTLWEVFFELIGARVRPALIFISTFKIADLLACFSAICLASLRRSPWVGGKHAEGKWLVLMWDAKIKVFCDSWGILSIGFLVRKRTPSNTTAKRVGGTKVQMEAFTGAFQLYFQIIIRGIFYRPK